MTLGLDCKSRRLNCWDLQQAIYLLVWCQLHQNSELKRQFHLQMSGGLMYQIANARGHNLRMRIERSLIFAKLGHLVNKYNFYI